MEFETTKSGRHTIHSGTIEAREDSEIEEELRKFWTHVVGTYGDIGGVSHLRIEVWADSGRLICFAVGEDGTIRVGNTTSQVTINRLAEQWLAIEDLPEEKFDDASDKLDRRYADLSRVASRKVGCEYVTRYFDADSEDEIAE